MSEGILASLILALIAACFLALGVFAASLFFGGL